MLTVARIVLLQIMLVPLLLLKVKSYTLLLPSLVHWAQGFMGTLLYLLWYAIRVIQEDLPCCRGSNLKKLVSA